jgi:hypothetical protein
MGERRLRKTVDPVRGKRWKHRIRATFDKSSVPINAIDPAFICDPRLPLYRYLEESIYGPLQTEPAPDILA